MGEEQIVDVSGAQLWTTASGTGPALVLCHGGPGHFDTLGPVADMVNDLVTVYRYDQRASGRSTGVPPFTVGRFVEDLEELRHHWGLDRLIVGGHSWGANLALAYCLKHPTRVKALVYISGPGITWDWHEQFKNNQNNRLSPDQQKQLSELNRKEKSNELLQLLYTADFADNTLTNKFEEFGLFQYPMNWEVNKQVNDDWIRQSKNIEVQAKNLNTPAIIIHGESDPRPLSIADKMSQTLKGSKLVTLLKVGHYPWLGKPHLVQKALRDFLLSQTKTIANRHTS